MCENKITDLTYLTYLTHLTNLTHLTHLTHLTYLTLNAYPCNAAAPLTISVNSVVIAA